MRKVLVLILSLLLLQGIKAQVPFAKFRITQAKIGGRDATQLYYDQKQYVAFYYDKNGDMAMVNISETNKRQSYGTIVITRPTEKIKETATDYACDIFYLRWHYYNNYDNNSGWATVLCSKIYKPQGVVFKMKIIPANLEALEFDGYMEGTLDIP
jgi:hypothetical protein